MTSFDTTHDRPLDRSWREHATALAAGLAGSGACPDPRWQAIVAAVPRQVFVPSFWALDAYNSPSVEVGAGDPGYLAALYADQPLITRWVPETLSWGPQVRTVTSSASQPSVVTVMLDRLDVRDGHRVLEIGTGTGYNAALLCTRLRDDLVTSIDIDPDLVDTARRRLASAGHHPHLHVGDGTAELPGDTAFDRIVATCSVQRIPPGWITRLAPGGRIVAPLTIGGALAVLDRTGTDEVTGHLDGTEVRFMSARRHVDEPLPAWVAPHLPDPAPDVTSHGLTDVDPAVLDDDVFRLWVALHHPRLLVTENWSDGRPTAAVVHAGGARADADRDPAAPGLWRVRQQGGRPWDTVETAWHTYLRAGRPPRHALRLTARTDGHQHVELPGPAGPVSWPLPR